MPKVVLCFFLILTQSLSRCEDTFLPTFFSNDESEQIVIGRLNEDIILPCSFKSGPEIVIHWNIQSNYVYSYYSGSDQLQNQDPRYSNRTSLFHSEIHNGNASLSIKKLNLLDEGIYICYVGTSSNKFKEKVVLKVGAFATPLMRYENSTGSSALICSVLSVYPHTKFTWQMDNTPISGNSIEEITSLGSLYITSTVNITASNSSYECAIENSLLEQAWTGRWAMKGDLHKRQNEDVLLSCELPNDLSLPNQDFTVTWSRMEHGTFSFLADFQSSSQNTIINESQLSCNTQLRNHGIKKSGAFFLRALTVSDSGEYLCTVSTSNYTLLTAQTLHVEMYETSSEIIFVPVVILTVLALLALIGCIIIKLRRLIPTHTDSRNSSSPSDGISLPLCQRTQRQDCDSSEDGRYQQGGSHTDDSEENMVKHKMISEEN